ncbi:hypothetical protein M3Y99_01933000 [Aphelenchoides fujianensis]|nr:hypothetical protein M3Y99_01933000 [Aphelenchoides fujianensis]
MSSLLRFVWIFASVCPALDALRCYYCASMSTKIAPHLWLHSAPCAQRRLASCPTARQSCVVVRVQHDRINFTVAGCAEESVILTFVGCERFVQLAAHGPTAVHLCQCAARPLQFGLPLGLRRGPRPLPLELLRLS